jgi:hypothetical protein
MFISSRSFPAVALALVAAAACSGEPETPAAQSQTRTTQQLNSPATLTGCLRAGEAANTFVLTASATSDGATPATYHLEGSGGTNLKDHVGRRIEVNGLIADQQHVATREASQPADQKATGTSGTPTVQTGTQLALRTIQVKTIRPLQEACE